MYEEVLLIEEATCKKLATERNWNSTGILRRALFIMEKYYSLFIPWRNSKTTRKWENVSTAGCYSQKKIPIQCDTMF